MGRHSQELKTDDGWFQFWFSDSHFCFRAETTEDIDKALKTLRMLRDGTYKGPFRAPPTMTKELFTSLVDQLLDRRTMLTGKDYGRRYVRKAAPE